MRSTFHAPTASAMPVSVKMTDRMAAAPIYGLVRIDAAGGYAEVIIPM